MDLSVQKMLPPATVRGKSAAKKTSAGSETEEALETASSDQSVDFKHGNTGYDALDSDQEQSGGESHQKRQGRRKTRELLSNDDLSELTSSLEEEQNTEKQAGEYMNLRAYQTVPAKPDKDEDRPHFEVNI